jgi:hypothetical protein
MSAAEENPIDNPLEALRALTRRPGERAEPRLAAVSETPFARAPKLDAARSTASQADRLESAMSEFVRSQIKPEAVSPPAVYKPAGTKSMLMASAVGITAAVAVAAVVALAFLTLFPRERDVVQSFAAAVPAAAPSDNSNPSSSQSRALGAADNADQDVTHEQSERLLQQFVQWRQNAAIASKP